MVNENGLNEEEVKKAEHVWKLLNYLEEYVKIAEAIPEEELLEMIEELPEERALALIYTLEEAFKYWGHLFD